MKSLRALVALFLISVFLASSALAQTSAINPSVPAQNSPLSSAAIRAQFAAAIADFNTLWAALSTAISNATNASNLTSGTVAPALLPLASTSTPGAVQCGSGTSCSGGVLSVTSTGGGGGGSAPGGSTGAVQYNAGSGALGGFALPTTGQVLVGTNSSGAMAPVTLAPSATVDTTNANNIASGTVAAARLPFASSTTPGAVSCGSGLACSTTGVATTTAPGSTGNIVYNNNGVPAPYAIGPGLVVTTSGDTTYLSSTATGDVAPAGSNGSIQYNDSGSFAGYGIGPSLYLSGGNLNVTGVPVGSTGAVQINGGSGAFGSLALTTTGQALVGTNGSGAMAPVTLAPSATIDTTNASNLASGTVAPALLPLGSSTTAGALRCGAGTSCSGGVVSGGITALTGDVSASGTGSVPSTVNAINGVGLGSTAATAGNLLIGSGNNWVTKPVSGDCVLTSAGGIVCTKTNGTGFASSAIIDTTNAGNISSGTLAAARLPLGNSGAPGALECGTGTSCSGGVLSVTSTSGGGGSPTGSYPQLQYNNGAGSFAGLSADTLASYAAHDTVMNGLAYDPRNAAWGSNPAICHAPDVFSGNGSQTAFTYTTPFAGSSSTDNTNFFVYIVPASGNATILTTSQFTVTGVNSGVGGTITLTTPPASGSSLIVLHDDTNGFENTVAVSSGGAGYIALPDNCWVQNTTWANNGNMIGANFSPNYSFNTYNSKPILHIIAPRGHEPTFGINLGSPYISQAFFEGFTIESGNFSVPALTNYLGVPVCIGTSAGMGGGNAPGIVVQYMDFAECANEFGAPMSGSSAYMFAVSRFNNYSAANNGTYGPFSDFKSINDDFVGATAYLGPQSGAPGAAGASMFEGDRFEFNPVGFVCDGCTLTNLEGAQIDGNSQCGVVLKNGWDHVTITGGWMRGNANGGYPNYQGDTAAGQDAHICFTGTGGGNGLYVSNVDFRTNYSEGSTAPLGSDGATSPPYVLDFDTTVNDIHLTGGNAPIIPGASGAAVIDFAAYRSNVPVNYTVDVNGQAVQGKVANGTLPGQARGLPANQWTSYYAFGDYDYTNPTFFPQMYDYIVAHNMGTAPTPFVSSNPSTGQYDCDVVDQQIFTNYNPTTQNNPLVTWVPGGADPVYGGGSGLTFNAHLADSTLCLEAGLTWLGTPQKNKIYAQSATTTGFSNSSIYGGALAKTSTVQGSALQWTLTTDGNPIDLTYELQVTGTGTPSGGAFTYQLDSTTTSAPIPTGGSGAWTYPFTSTSQAPATVRIPNVAAGGHTLSLLVTSTSSGLNPVTIDYVSSAPGYTNSTGAPGVYIAGQLQEGGGGQATATATFNSMIYAQAVQAFADGENVHFVPVRNSQCCNTGSDIVPSANSAYPYALSALGEQHLADAMGAAIQPQKNPGQIINPLDYGASCNTQAFANNYLSGDQVSHSVTTTEGSSVIEVSNFNPQPCTATQTGGACNIGQVITVWSGCNPGPTGYILSATTTSITVGGWPNGAGCSSTGGMALISGYPRNPNDPSTAEDDTNPTHTATVIAGQSGGKVVMPANCGIGQGKAGSRTPLTVAPGVLLEGNAGGNLYAGNTHDQYNTPTKLFVMSTLFPDDTQYGIRTNNYNSAGMLQTRIKDLAMIPVGWPAYEVGYMGACIGDSGASALSNAQFIIDHVTTSLCPVGVGVPRGENYAVNFTGQITGNTLNVTSLTPTIPNGTTDNGDLIQWLAIGDVITGTGVPANEVITSIPDGVGGPVNDYGPILGNYGVSISATTGSVSMNKVAIAGVLNFGSIFSQYNNNGIDINGDCSDCWTVGDVHTTFGTGWHLGPHGGGSGNAANRIELGRFEDGGSIICDECIDTQIMNVQFQFNDGPIIFVGGAFADTIIGGMMQENGPEILLEDTSSNIDVSGVDMYAETGFSGGPLFVTGTGFSGNNISVEGGEAYNFSPSNFTNGAPSAYKQDVAGWQYINTTQSAFSVTSTGGFGVGGIARAGTSLDLGLTTSPMVLPPGSTGSRPASPIQGELWNNASTGYPEIYTSGWNTIYPSAPGYINGLIPSNDATSPTTTLDISAGAATSDDGLTNMVNPFAFTKTTASWATGWGHGALDNGTIAASTWYAIFEIERVDTSTPDYVFSTSSTLPKMPANFTKKRLIGYFVTDSSAHILSYTVTQKASGVDRYAYTADPTLDISTTSGLGTTATTYALNVPTGVPVSPIIEASIGNTTTAPVAVYISSLDEADLAPTTSSPFTGVPGYSLQVLTTGGIVSNTFDGGLMTSTSGTLRFRASQAGTGVSVVTKGFEFCPGCNYSPAGNIAIDGQSAIASTTSTTMSLTISTVSGNDIIAVAQVGFEDYGISSISDTASLTWNNYYTTNVDGNALSVWWALATSPLSSDVITVTTGGAGVGDSQAFGVAGANTTTPFDPHSGLPYFTSDGFGSYTSISTAPTTSKAKGLVLNLFSGHGVEYGLPPVIPTGYNNLIPPTGVPGTPSYAEWYGSTSFSYISNPLAGGSITYGMPQAFSLANMLTVVFQAANQ
jgi:hypothetical protein